MILDSELRPATDQVPEGAELLIHELGPVITLTREELAGLDSERQYALAVDIGSRSHPPSALITGAGSSWRDHQAASSEDRTSGRHSASGARADG